MANLLFQQEQGIKDLLIQMNALLTKHIEVHDALFNPPLRSRIPIPIIMKKIDFKAQYEKAQDISNELEECLKKAVIMNKFGKMNNATYQTIDEYGQSFFASICKLTEVAYELYLKKERLNNLSLNEYNIKVEQYNEFEQIRIISSNKLNRLAKEYFK